MYEGKYLAQEVRSLDVDGHGHVKVLLGSVLEVLHGCYSSIGNYNVDFAEPVDRLLDKLLDFGNGADVGLDGKGSVTANRFDQFFGGAGIGGIVDDYAGAIFGKTKGSCFAYTFGSACNQGYFSCKRARGHVGLMMVEER